jgi:hypothetical protein
MNLQSLVAQVVTPVAVLAKPVKVSPTTKAPKVAKPTKPAKVAKVKAVKPTKVPKVALVPYTVFFKEARNKWMAVNGLGRTEAARKTKEAALAFLKTKYDVIGKVV